MSKFLSASLSPSIIIQVTPANSSNMNRYHHQPYALPSADSSTMALVPYVSSCSSAIPKKRSRQNSSNGSQDIDIDGSSICPGDDIIMGGVVASGEPLFLGAPPTTSQVPPWEILAHGVDQGANMPNMNVTNGISPLPSIKLDDVLANTIPVMRHVPREAIDGFTSEFIKVLDNLLHAPTLTTLTHYFLFTKLTLFLAHRGGKRHQHDLARTIQLRLDRWAGEDYLGLFAEAQQKSSPLQSQYELRSGRGKATRRRVLQYAEDSEFSKACEALISNPPILPTTSVLEHIKNLHPRRAPLLQQSDVANCQTFPLPFQAEEVAAAIRSFRKASGAGFSRMRPAILQELLSGSKAMPLLESLAALTHRMACGLLPQWMAPLLTGALLVALRKPDGNPRPIACGDILRRLTSKILLTRVQPHMAKQLAPLQVGFGVPAGIEHMAHRIRSFIEEEGEANFQPFLALDLSNAFNAVDRGAIHKAVRQKVPEIESWYLWGYGTAGRLQFGSYVLESQQGVQQGDPLSGLLFSLAIHPGITELANLPGIIWSGWFYDDGTLHGSSEALQQAYSLAKQHFAAINVQVNPAKSKLWVSQKLALPNSNIPQLSWLVVLGHTLRLASSGAPHGQSFRPLTEVL